MSTGQSAGGCAPLGQEHRRELLRELANVFRTHDDVDSVLDDMGVASSRRPHWHGSSETAWREAFGGFEAGMLPEWIRSLLSAVLPRYPYNATFLAIAREYAPGVADRAGQPLRRAGRLLASPDAPAVSGGAADSRLHAIMDADHFLSRLALKGINPAGPADLVFSGRGEERRQLRRWADGLGPALLVITGRPGSGKSALLGTVVYSAHPKLRLGYHDELRKSGPVPARIDRLAIVHARGRSVHDITWALATQWDLDDGRYRSWTPGALVDAVKYLPEPPSLVLDALDRASHPQDVISALVLPLAPACRLLVATRPGASLDDLAAAARRVGLAGEIGYLDLDLVAPADLEDYVLLRLQRANRDLPRAARLALHAGIGKALTTGDGPALGYGHYLVASLWMGALLRQRELSTAPGELRGRISGLPLSVPGIVDLDIRLSAGPGSDWARPVIAALAFAEGSGMPEAIIRRIAPGFLLAAGLPGDGNGRALAPGGPTGAQIAETILTLDPHLHCAVDDHGALLYRLGHPDLVAAARRDPYRLGLGPRDRP